MITAITILLTMVLIKIFIEDLRERKVSLYLFLIAILAGGYLHFHQGLHVVFLFVISLNVSMLGILTVALWLYTELKMQKKLRDTFGLGDFLFFLFLGVSFPSVTFLVLFSFSLIFSLLLFVIVRGSLRNKMVPLAGFQSVFVGLVFVLNSFFHVIDLYAI